MDYINILSRCLVQGMNSSHTHTPLSGRRYLKGQTVSMTSLSLFRLESGDIASDDLHSWPTYLLKGLNHMMVEIVSQTKQNEASEVMPTKMKNYILRIQRDLKTRFDFDINMVMGKIFDDTKNGVLSVINKKNTLTSVRREAPTRS